MINDEVCKRCKSKIEPSIKKSSAGKEFKVKGIKCQNCGYNLKRCRKCQSEKIQIKKRCLCRKCNQKYMNLREKFIVIKSEREFYKNYPEPKNLIYHNTRFGFNNFTYEPDFYDFERDVFIEVFSTFEIYKQYKHRTKLFKKYFPNILIEFRYPNGLVIPESIWDFAI